MSTSGKSGDEPAIAELIEQLGDPNPVTREQARRSLEQRGGPEVTRALVEELLDPRPHVRWEAAKGLSAIADPVAAPALLHALNDADEDVRWVAGDALIALRQSGLFAVLSGLTRLSRSLEFRNGAHHVLHELRKTVNAAEIAPVLEALEEYEPAVAAPPAAHKALVRLKIGLEGSE